MENVTRLLTDTKKHILLIEGNITMVGKDLGTVDSWPCRIKKYMVRLLGENILSNRLLEENVTACMDPGTAGL